MKKTPSDDRTPSFRPTDRPTDPSYLQLPLQLQPRLPLKWRRNSRPRNVTPNRHLQRHHHLHVRRTPGDIPFHPLPLEKPLSERRERVTPPPVGNPSRGLLRISGHIPFRPLLLEKPPLEQWRLKPPPLGWNCFRGPMLTSMILLRPLPLMSSFGASRRWHHPPQPQQHQQQHQQQQQQPRDAQGNGKGRGKGEGAVKEALAAQETRAPRHDERKHEKTRAKRTQLYIPCSVYEYYKSRTANLLCGIRRVMA